VIGGRWSVVGGQWSVVGGQWSVVGGWWSVVGWLEQDRKDMPLSTRSFQKGVKRIKAAGVSLVVRY